MIYFVYILRCSDNTFYTGYTTNLTRRLHAHNNTHTGARYTRGRRPVKMVLSEEYPTLSEALKREREIKGLTRAEKVLLVKRKKSA